METSPHTRGKPVSDLVERGFKGNIPAYAGKAIGEPKPEPCLRKHPRIRGESLRNPNRMRARPETSPHTRGKPVRTAGSFSRRRNIPAYAGKAWAIREPMPMAGETSPHTRGKLVTMPHERQQRGNIPAYAGKANLENDGARIFQKHPRIRGESLDVGLTWAAVTETSPHTRGKPSAKNFIPLNPRNIPAYAGKASTILSLASLRRKHPRIRGESSTEASVAVIDCETSPHTRGKQTIQ